MEQIKTKTPAMNFPTTYAGTVTVPLPDDDVVRPVIEAYYGGAYQPDTTLSSPTTGRSANSLPHLVRSRHASTSCRSPSSFSWPCGSIAAVSTWSSEFEDRKVRTNVLSPGPVDTPMFDGQYPSKEGAAERESRSLR